MNVSKWKASVNSLQDPAMGINTCTIIKDRGAIMINSGPPHKADLFQKFLYEATIAGLRERIPSGVPHQMPSGL